MEKATSSLSNEIEAMAAIGRALGDLTDAAARQRVLRWASERFGSEIAPHAAEAVAVVSTDPDLAVDNLTDIFAVEAPAAPDDDLLVEAPAVIEKPKQPLESVLRSFAAEFQAFADEWNGAAA